MARPQTIQIFLPQGDPRGIRVAEITTRTIRVIEIPRSALDLFLKMPEADQVGVYYLFGDDTEAYIPRLYVGQSGSMGSRLVRHNQTKDYWNKAFVAVSLSNAMTQTHALFLEWYSIQKASAAGRCKLENGTGGSRPHTPEPLEADCLEIHDTIAILLATLGRPIFEPLLASSTEDAESEADAAEVFYCKGPEAQGSGQYTTEGFVVYKGSVARSTVVDSIKGSAQERVREELVSEGILVPQNGHLVFARDHLFNSPSTAAMVILGRSANGWLEWKNSHGQTLDAKKRQSASALVPDQE